MKPRQLRILLLFISLVLLALPLVVAHGAGGRIEGKVTDPKGAAIAGAIVTVTDPVSNQNFRATTDGEGRYKVEDVPAGTYLLVVSAKGFSEGRRDEVKVQDGAVATVDLKLEIAPVEAAVTRPSIGAAKYISPLRRVKTFASRFRIRLLTVAKGPLNSLSVFPICRSC